MFSRRDKAQLPTAAEHCPAAPSVRSRFPGATSCSGTPLEPAVSRKASNRSCSAWVASGRREEVLDGGGRLHDRGRLRGRHHPEPDLRGSVFGSHRSYRGRARRFSTRRSPSIEEMLRIFLGEPRPDAGHAPGKRRRLAVPLGRLYLSTQRRRAPPRRRGRGFEERLHAANYEAIVTTEIAPATAFYYAEDYHQQYLAKNPSGYCGLGGTGVSCPIGVTSAD